jgi:hypothetical protein
MPDFGRESRQFHKLIGAIRVIGGKAFRSSRHTVPNARILAAICGDNLQRIDKLFTGMALATVRKNRIDSIRASMRNNESWQSRNKVRIG